MPVKVQFIMGDPETMTEGGTRVWLKKANCAPPQDEDSQRVLALFLQKKSKVYGFLQQRAFIDDLAKFVGELDWGGKSRKPVRLAHFFRTFGGGRVDYLGAPDDDEYLHPRDIVDLNRMGRGLTVEHLSMGEMFDLCDVLFVAEEHANQSATKYLHICHALLAGVPKYEVRVMLDGFNQRRGLGNVPETVGKFEIMKNFPKMSEMYRHYAFYGLEPAETAMFSLCGKILQLGKTDQCKAARWFYRVLRDDEEINAVARTPKNLRCPDYEDLVDDAKNFEQAKEMHLDPEAARRIKAAADVIEFANRSAIRMDANIAWGQVIEEVLALPPKMEVVVDPSDRAIGLCTDAEGEPVKGAPPVGPTSKKKKLDARVLVICGTNHALSRSEHGVPAQGAIQHARVRTLVIVDDATTNLQYRKLDGSLNYVYTIPDAYVALQHYFAKPPF